jgi:hypothetical protein
MFAIPVLSRLTPVDRWKTVFGYSDLCFVGAGDCLSKTQVLSGRFERMKKIYADGGYRRELEKKSKKTSGVTWKSPCAQTNQPDSPLCPNNGL